LLLLKIVIAWARERYYILLSAVLFIADDHRTPEASGETRIAIVNEKRPFDVGGCGAAGEHWNADRGTRTDRGHLRTIALVGVAADRLRRYIDGKSGHNARLSRPTVIGPGRIVWSWVSRNARITHNRNFVTDAAST